MYTELRFYVLYRSWLISILLHDGRRVFHKHVFLAPKETHCLIHSWSIQATYLDAVALENKTTTVTGDEKIELNVFHAEYHSLDPRHSPAAAASSKQPRIHVIKDPKAPPRHPANLAKAQWAPNGWTGTGKVSKPIGMVVASGGEWWLLQWDGCRVSMRFVNPDENRQKIHDYSMWLTKIRKNGGNKATTMMLTQKTAKPTDWFVRIRILVNDHI